MDYILIVEDEIIAREAITVRVESIIKALKLDNKYKATAVDTIEEMEKFIEGKSIKGILLDISLPYSHMDEIDWSAGLKLAKKMEKEYPKIPIVIFTGRGDPFPEEDAKKLKNVIAFFRKPMPGLELRDAIETMLKGISK